MISKATAQERFVGRLGDLQIGDGPKETTKEESLKLGSLLSSKSYYSPDQDRDREGKFAPEGGGGGGGGDGGKSGEITDTRSKFITIEQVGWTKDTSTRALNDLNSKQIASADKEWFEHEFGDEVEMSEFGFFRSGTLYAVPNEIDEPKKFAKVSFRPEELGYVQSSVTKSLVKKKLKSGVVNDRSLPVVAFDLAIKRGVLASGNHNAAAQVLATGRVVALTSVLSSPSKTRGRPGRYRKPRTTDFE